MLGSDSVSIDHCNREANQVTHALARNTFVGKQNSTLVNGPPDFILEHLVYDVTIFSNY